MFCSEYHLKQTHMVLKCDVKRGIAESKIAVFNARFTLDTYITNHPDFRFAFDTRDVDPDAPKFVKKMMAAGIAADVGPMASVAGGLSEIATDTMIATLCKSAIAENGGDISIKGIREAKIGIYRGQNRLAGTVGFLIKPEDLPLGICTSAGEVGHSISLGDADAVVVCSKSAFLSDAAATAIANIVSLNDSEASIQRALERAEAIEGVTGCLVLIGALVGRTGHLPEMVEVLDADL